MNSLKNYFRLLAEDQPVGAEGHFWKPITAGLSYLYGGGLAVVRQLYEKKILPAKHLPFPVISVGNLTWGGTGKTPLVEYFARRVIERRKTPLVLTRGYGQDEIEQLRAHLPDARFGVGRERYRIARGISRKERVDVAILDDGFQHWKMARDIEIVTLNALNPFGNGRLFPRGILREPREALGRANVVVLSHVNLISSDALDKLRNQIRDLAPQSLIAESCLEPLFLFRARRRSRISPPELANRRVTTFSALGNPRSFQLLLTRIGVKPIRNFEFCDHHLFTQQELEEIRRVSREGNADEIITTEKDFYRAPQLITQVMDPLVLVTRLRISAGEEILTDRVFRLLGVS